MLQSRTPMATFIIKYQNILFYLNKCFVMFRIGSLLLRLFFYIQCVSYGVSCSFFLNSKFLVACIVFMYLFIFFFLSFWSVFGDGSSSILKDWNFTIIVITRFSEYSINSISSPFKSNIVYDCKYLSFRIETSIGYHSRSFDYFYEFQFVE